MEEIKIIVADKIASVEGTPIIICGNSDYVVNFAFDDEWADKKEKTAHFVYYQDGLKRNIPVEFEGNTCNVPVLVNTEQVSIGVSASGVVTTTGADVRCKKSILCEVDKEEQDLFELGKKSVPNVLEYATNGQSTFKNATFPENYELTLNLPNITFIGSMFSNAKNIVKITLKGNIAGAVLESSSAFAGTSLVTIDLTEFCMKVKNAHNLFGNSKVLQEIKGIIDLTESTANSSIAYFCAELEEIRFKANSIKLSISFSHSSKLSTESIQSIIDGLADLTGADAQALSLHSTVSSALTSEQMTQIESKNWKLT